MLPNFPSLSFLPLVIVILGIAFTALILSCNSKLFDISCYQGITYEQHSPCSSSRNYLSMCFNPYSLPSAFASVIFKHSESVLIISLMTQSIWEGSFRKMLKCIIIHTRNNSVQWMADNQDIWTSVKKKNKNSFIYTGEEDRIENEQVRANGVIWWWEIGLLAEYIWIFFSPQEWMQTHKITYGLTVP